MAEGMNGVLAGRREKVGIINLHTEKSLESDLEPKRHINRFEAEKFW